jgi:hypothetical protein
MWFNACLWVTFVAAAFEAETNTNPYFINLDEDAFRSNRFMFILKKPVTVFGSKGADVWLMSLAVLRDHCKVTFNQDTNEVFVTAGKGDTYKNGQKLAEGAQEKLNIFDRLAIGKNDSSLSLLSCLSCFGCALSNCVIDGFVVNVQGIS